MKLIKYCFFGLFVCCFLSNSFAQKKDKKKSKKEKEVVIQSNNVPMVQYQKTATGLSFLIHKNENGPSAKRGDLVSLHLIMKNAQGNELRNTYTEGKPLLFPMRFSAFEGDLNEGIELLSTGDSATFLVLADSMYAKVFKKPLPENVKAGSFLNFQVKILDIKSQQDYLNEQQQKHTEYVQNHQTELEARKQKEEAQIQAYMKGKGFKYIKTANGAYYAVIKKGQGRKIKKGDAIVFHYVGSLMNDLTEFESTYILGRPAAFTLGENSVIKGWEEVFSQLTEGDECKMIIPSHLGFGHIAKGEKVPEYSILIFDVKIITVK